jgi:hypothetical protein
MKSRDIQVIAKRIIDRMPGFARKGSMVIGPLTNGILRGIYFEDSGFDKLAFYVWVFVQPLYVPAKNVTFNLGKRIGGGSGKRWRLDESNIAEKIVAAIEEEGLSLLESTGTPEGLCSWIDSLPAYNDPYVRQAKAYSLAAAHRLKEAFAEFKELRISLNSSVPWMAEMSSRAASLSELLESDPSRVDAELLKCRSETAANLGLSELA